MWCRNRNWVRAVSYTHLPLDEGKMAWRAFCCMKNRFQLPGSALIHVEKRIPIAAGLAGGSSNAATAVSYTHLLMPLKEENGFLPDLDAIPTAVADKAKIMWLNYPNNPTGAIAPPEFFEKAVAFAKKHDILICHDNAYSEMTYDGYVAPSFLETPGAMDVAVEFNSLSKPFNIDVYKRQSSLQTGGGNPGTRRGSPLWWA